MMKIKGILSMLLAVIMLTTAVIAAIPPITASAANSAASSDFEIGENIYRYEFINGEMVVDGQADDKYFNSVSNMMTKFVGITSAAELLERELNAKMLMSATSSDGMYTIYVNVYTGFMYYKNNLTGQILMSNYYNYDHTSTSTDEEMLSQISISFSNIITGSSDTYTSFADAAAYGQIYVTKLTNGLRVNYTMGDTKVRYVVPGAIPEENYLYNLFLPIFNKYSEIINNRILTTKIDENINLGIPAIETEKALRDYYFGKTEGKVASTAIQFFSEYLRYYGFVKSDNHLAYDNSSLFDLAATIFEKDTSAPIKEKSEFVTSGAIDDFDSVFDSLAQLFDLRATISYCPAHKSGGTASDPDHCRRCGAELVDSTVMNYIFYGFDGRLDLQAIDDYLVFLNSTMKMFGHTAITEGDLEVSSDLYGPLLNILVKKYLSADDGNYVHLDKENLLTNTDYQSLEKLIGIYCIYVDDPTFSYSDMEAYEKACNWTQEYKSKPVFRCALEYTFNDDGSLCVTLPANSISFDESQYVLGTITPLKYFGTGLLITADSQGINSGYAFYPDGSGAIVNYSDFYSLTKGRGTNVDLHAPIYGLDYAYSDLYSIVGDYREQVTMPVYGMVYTENTDDDTRALLLNNGKAASAVEAATLNNGFFAVVEDGAALATLMMTFSSGGSKFATAYASYQPYSSDTYDLSQTISVGDLGSYKMVSESKYNGNYVTRYTMLTDEKLNSIYGVNYDASYVGMANCYRDILKADGTITALAEIGNDLPLYIEAFGSMEVTKKILSFPVEVSLELTTFEDIRTMYDQLADAKNVLVGKANEYQQKANAEEKDLELKALYEQKAQSYLTLANKISNITNVNFRLTGFANGGMEYTYPSKVKWDKVVGGKSGFEELIRYASDVSARDGANLGIYPEFDFLYINNTSMFDGISAGKITSKLIDNRYASKQLYNSVTHAYEEIITSVVSADALAELYVKFNKDFSDYNLKSISVSTLGSDLNSNFDDDNPINRDEAAGYVSDLLSAMRNDGYDIMVNKGNAYSIEYASHIIDAYIDSSHLTQSSYTIPFYGMVLHGYVNYAGNALNYSGDPDYDILRSIESGASLYYILSYQNTEKMKEDENLNKYYGINYSNWFDKVVEQYAIINDAIGGLQNYEIVDHKILTVERFMDDAERDKAYSSLVNELIDKLEEKIQLEIDKVFADMLAAGENGKGIQVDIDIDAILAEASDLLNLENNLQLVGDYSNEIKWNIKAYLIECEEAFNAKYSGNDPVTIYIDSVGKYESKYDYVTDSKSDDGANYDYTTFTLSNYNVVMVTYRDMNDPANVVKFVLNYNIYDVIVNVDGQSFMLGKYEFKSIK